MDKEDVTKADATNDSKALQVKQSDVNAGLKVFNLLDENQLAAAEIFIKKIIASDKSGIKSIPEGLAVLMRAQDLNLPFSSCIEHIHVINGKTGVDVHIVKSLLSRAGVTWECTKDYTPQYQYTDGNTIYKETQLPQYCVKCRTAKEAEEKTNDEVIGVYPLRYYQDLKGNVFNEFEISDKCAIAINKVQAMAFAKEGKYPIVRIPAQPIDFVTEYEFTRYFMINGKERTRKCKSHFSYTEAAQAELLSKDNYTKYTRLMIDVRAFTLGARDIADDVIMGVMETSEIKIIEDVPIVDTDFEEVN